MESEAIINAQAARSRLDAAEREVREADYAKQKEFLAELSALCNRYRLRLVAPCHIYINDPPLGAVDVTADNVLHQ